MQESKQEVTKVVFLVQNGGKSTECIQPSNILYFPENMDVHSELDLPCHACAQGLRGYFFVGLCKSTGRAIVVTKASALV